MTSQLTASSPKISHGAKRPMGVKCLFVDDSELNLITVKTIFEEMGVDLDITKCSRHALHLCKTCQYDLVLVDYHMPELNGIELTERIRESPDSKNRNTIFLGFSSLSQDEFFELDRNHVMDGCLRKTI